MDKIFRGISCTNFFIGFFAFLVLTASTQSEPQKSCSKNSDSFQGQCSNETECEAACKEDNDSRQLTGFSCQEESLLSYDQDKYLKCVKMVGGQRAVDCEKKVDARTPSLTENPLVWNCVNNYDYQRPMVCEATLRLAGFKEDEISCVRLYLTLRQACKATAMITSKRKKCICTYNC